MTVSLDNLIEATGWSMIHSLWMGALAYGLILLLLEAFPDTQPRTRYAIGFSTLAVLFAGFLAVLFSKLEWKNADIPPGESVFPSYMPRGMFPGATESLLSTAVGYLAVGYLAGLCAQSILLALGYRRLRELRRAALLPVPDEWKDIFSRVLPQLGLSRQVSFRLSEKAKTPMVIGYMKPLILFPVAAVNHLDIEQVEAVLIHELSHIRRNDYLLNVFKTGMETLLFFNPFVWLVGRMIEQERENACDDLVIMHVGKPVAYAHALLQLAAIAGNNGSGRLILAASGKNRSQLYQRIRRITEAHVTRRSIRQQVWVLAFAVLAACSVAWVETGNDKRPGRPDPASPWPGSGGVRAVSGDASVTADTVYVGNDPSSMVKVYPDRSGTVDTSHKEAVKRQGDSLRKVFESPEWQEKIRKQARLSDSLKRWFESAEFKSHMDAVKRQGDSLRKVFESPEWQEKIHKQARLSDSLKGWFESAEFKSHMDAVKRQGDSLRKVFESPEWEEKIRKQARLSDSLKRWFESAEFKSHMNAVKREADSLWRRLGPR